VGSEEVSKGNNKLQYVLRSLAKDLGLHRHPLFYRGSVWGTWRWEYDYGSKEYWLTVVYFLFAWFIQAYCHYVGQYAFLQTQGVPISDVVIKGYMLDIKYQADVLRAEVELGVLLFGPGTNMIMFCAFMGIAAFSYWWLDAFTEQGCRLISVWGILAMLDPVSTTIVNLLEKDTTNGDIYKLYNKFLLEEGSGVTGIFLTVTSYAIVMCFQAIVLFYYLLRIHMNGHMQDVYARLHGSEFCFFVPNDGEISWKEVQYECRRATGWRGENGELKKVQVVDYLHCDRYDGNWKQKTTVTTIYIKSRNGTQEIHRQFVRLPQGCIMERFGAEQEQISDVKTNERNTRRHSAAVHGVLLDAIAGAGLRQRHNESRAIGPANLEEFSEKAQMQH